MLKFFGILLVALPVLLFINANFGYEVPAYSGNTLTTMQWVAGNLAVANVFIDIPTLLTLTALAITATVVVAGLRLALFVWSILNRF